MNIFWILCFICPYCMIVALFASKTPKRPLNFPLLCHHERVHLCCNFFFVTHSTGILIYPGTSRCRIELFWTLVCQKIFNSPFVRFTFMFCCRISSMTNNTTIFWIPCICCFFCNSLCHTGLGRSNMRNPSVTLQAIIFLMKIC